jgi:flagellar capping protein FliD
MIATNSCLRKKERELEALIKGEQVDEEAEDNQEPDSQSAENTQVSDESDTEQKETRSVESKESEEVDTESDGLSAEEKSFKKRYGDIRKLLQTKEKDWDAKFEKLQGQLDKATKNELVLPKSKEEIEAWSSKYPDVAGIVEAIAENKAAEKASFFG